MERSAMLQIRLTPAEKKLLTANAKSQGLSVASLVRLTLLNSNLHFVADTLKERKKKR